MDTTVLQEALPVPCNTDKRNFIDSSSPASPSSLSPASLAKSSTPATPELPAVSISAASVPQVHLQEPSPTSSKPQSPAPHMLSKPNGSRTHSSSGKPRHILAEIPSAADLYAPSTGSRSSPSVASSDTPSSSHSGMGESKHRFERLPDGSHAHHLSAPKRQQFLSNQVRRLRDLLEGRKDKEHYHHGSHHLHPDALEHPLSLLKEKLADFEGDRSSSPASFGSTAGKKKHSVKEEFVHKYGDLSQVVGKGAFGTVRLAVKKTPESAQESTSAVKEFKINHGESQKSYMRRLTSEFCIASSLKHINVIQTMDLLQLHHDTYSEVMEYCAGGDLHSLIASATTLGETESNCFFAQLINGVSFLHSMGVVHRDLKPENLLLTADGCLKIADFGNSEVFRMPWEKKVRSSASIRGSGPFIAPEEFTEDTFDARKVDMWSCGIIYMCMRLGRYNWFEAKEGDPIWDSFLYKLEQFKVLDEKEKPTNPHLTAIEQATHSNLAWPQRVSQVIDRLLDPNPRTRWHVGQVLDSQWMEHVDNCHPTERVADQVLDESDFNPTPSQRVGSKVLEQGSNMTGCKIVKEVKTHNGEVLPSSPSPSSSSSPSSRSTSSKSSREP
ncbi:serine/threonine-protein kinase HAL4/sat4 [Podila verticillata]|nr:serine/threonine-protein kinase HAL4/sat4 [Podila verticillata]